MLTKTVATSILIGIVFGTTLSFMGILVPKQIQAQNGIELGSMTTAMANPNSSTRGSSSLVLVDGTTNAAGVDTFSAAGYIASLILPVSPIDNHTGNINMTSSSTATLASVVPAKTFILSGAWHLKAENGNITYFDVKFTKVHLDSSNRHVHEISNFHPASNNTPIRLDANGTTTIVGTVDVALNHAITWTNVKTVITIDKLSTITVMLDPKDTSNHFLGQSIYGTVDMLKNKDGNNVTMFPRP